MVWHNSNEAFTPRDLVSLLDEFPDMVQVVSTEGHFLYVNRFWRQRLGYDERDLSAMSFLDILHPDHQQPWKSIFRAVLGGNRLDHFEMVLVAKDGTQVPVDSSVWSHQVNGMPAYVVSNFRDTVGLARGEQQISKLLYRDELTGLLNRRGFSVRSVPVLEILENNPNRLSGWIVALHAENLASIERVHGVAELQNAYRLVADVLHKALRAHDLVARIDRDSFAAIVTLPPKYQMSFVLARLKAALQHANRQANKPYQVDLRSGFVEIARDLTIEEALQRALASALKTHGLPGQPTPDQVARALRSSQATAPELGAFVDHDHPTKSTR